MPRATRPTNPPGWARRWKTLRVIAVSFCLLAVVARPSPSTDLVLRVLPLRGPSSVLPPTVSPAWHPFPPRPAVLPQGCPLLLGGHPFLPGQTLPTPPHQPPSPPKSAWRPRTRQAEAAQVRDTEPAAGGEGRGEGSAAVEETGAATHPRLWNRSHWAAARCVASANRGDRVTRTGCWISLRPGPGPAPPPLTCPPGQAEAARESRGLDVAAAHLGAEGRTGVLERGLAPLASEARGAGAEEAGG